jgi:hypothetical protein
VVIFAGEGEVDGEEVAWGEGASGRGVKMGI